MPTTDESINTLRLVYLLSMNSQRSVFVYTKDKKIVYEYKDKVISTTISQAFKDEFKTFSRDIENDCEKMKKELGEMNVSYFPDYDYFTHQNMSQTIDI